VTRIEKLVERICARPPTARFSDVQTLLAALGWTIGRERGSHVTFVKEGECAIVVPKDGGRRVKRVYLDEICERLGLDE
jgi:predicted RNA binding protein YcfA (HicA-like mRNA interferase family)